MGKQKISVTIEEDLVKTIEAMLVSGVFRNRSHIIEYSLNKLVEKENE